MKKIIKVLSLLCAVTLIISSTVFSSGNISASESESENLNIESEDLSLVRSNLSVDVYTQVYTVLTNNADGYIDDYAGAYIDSEGNLHIQFVENAENPYAQLLISNAITDSMSKDRNSKMLTRTTQDAIAEDLVTIEIKPFSYNDLIAVKELITDAFEDRYIITALKQETNSVNVCAIAQEDIDQIKEYLENEITIYQDGMVNFFLEEDTIGTLTKSAYPGEQIQSYAGEGSIGFNAYYNNRWGIVTCGHVAPPGQILSCADGTLEEPAFSYIGGNLDVAFIPYPVGAGWTPTANLYPINVIYREATLSEMIEGGPIVKYGITTNRTTGVILSASINAPINYGSRDNPDIRTIRDCFSFDNTSIEGDSGGPIGRGGIKQVFRLLGITVGKMNNLGNGGYGIKLSNIKSKYPMVVKISSVYK